MASYYVWSGATGSANGTSWANAYTTLTLAFSGKTAGDVFYVAHDHAESTAAAITLTTQGTVSNPSKVICANRAGTVPPVAGDLRATATVTVTGSNSITLSGFTHYDGIIFLAPANIFVPGGTGQWMRLDNCSLRTTTGSGIVIAGTAITGTLVELNNTTMSFGVAGSIVSISGFLRWRNTPLALIGAAVPTILFTNTTRAGSVECIGVDLSAAGAGSTLVSGSANSFFTTFKFVDCKLNASVLKSQVPITVGSTEMDFVRSGASGNYTVFRQRISGTLDQEITIVRTGGASDGTTPISWKVITTANCNYSMPFDCPPIAIWNDTTGSAKTATIECIASAIMTDQECWVDLEYLGDASSPQGSFVNDGMANLLTTPANQTTSTATWGGALTGKFKLNVTFTAQQRGWVYARVKVGKASTTVYIDPLITLT